MLSFHLFLSKEYLKIEIEVFLSFKMDTNEKENAILPQNKAIVIIRRSVNLVMPMALAGKYLGTLN